MLTVRSAPLRCCKRYTPSKTFSKSLNAADYFINRDTDSNLSRGIILVSNGVPYIYFKCGSLIVSWTVGIFGRQKTKRNGRLESFFKKDDDYENLRP